MIQLNDLSKELVDATESEMSNLSGGAIAFGGVAVATTVGTIYDSLTGTDPNTITKGLGRAVVLGAAAGLYTLAVAGPQAAGLSD